MKKLVMVLLCLMISAPVYANNWKNYITAPDKVVDPTTIFSSKTDFFQHMAWWNATEIPHTMTTYMDTDKNGSIDEVWGFNILKEFKLPDCNLNSEPEEKKGTITFSTCHSNQMQEPYFYIIESKGWICHLCPLLYMKEETIRIL